MTESNSQSTPSKKGRVSGLERLGLRVSSMINHPVAQIRRWVTIHRLDTDEDRDWEQVVNLLSETDGIDVTFNGDGSVTLRWEARSEEDRMIDMSEREEELAPF
jgi:hypothetical protein